MVKDQAKWDQMVTITSALGGAKILAGIILFLIMPDNSACPTVSVLICISFVDKNRTLSATFVRVSDGKNVA